MKLTTRRQIYGGEPEPMDMQQPPGVNLTTEQWNVVLGHLDAGQHRIVRPIIDSLVAQLQQQSRPASPMSHVGQQGTLPPIQGVPQEADNA